MCLKSNLMSNNVICKKLQNEKNFIITSTRLISKSDSTKELQKNRIKNIYPKLDVKILDLHNESAKNLNNI